MKEKERERKLGLACERKSLILPVPNIGKYNFADPKSGEVKFCLSRKAGKYYFAGLKSEEVLICSSKKRKS